MSGAAGAPHTHTLPPQRTGFAASFAIPRYPGVVRPHKCDGVARHQTPEVCARYDEYEHVAGIRRGLDPAGRKVDRGHSGLYGAVGVMRLDIGHRLRGDGSNGLDLDPHARWT
jgi:hypothetical protein